MKISSIESWKPARYFPESYPGESPNSSYLYCDNLVLPIDYESGYGFQVFNSSENPKNLNEFLLNNNLPVLEDRFPIIAYGANRNPATISIKLKNYKYKSSRIKEVIPMLKGVLQNADVVASGLHGQGYFYGDLLLNSKFAAGCSIEIWISLLDKDQLRVMNDSEGIKSKLYSLAWIDDVFLSDTKKKLRSLVYVSNEPILILNSEPVAFNQVKANNRRIPSMNALEMLDTFLEAFNLKKETSKISGIPIDSQFASELMKYLNGQWWYQFNTHNIPLLGFKQILDLFKNAIKTNYSQDGSTSYLRRLNQLVLPQEAYSLDDDFTFKKMIEK